MTSYNQLFIMFDQMRHDWLGYRGADFVDTPNLDALASTGKVFTQTTCNSPVCAASRIGLATGIRPHRMGALNNNAFLQNSRRTYYQELRDHGYYVACSGKLDLAKPDPYNGVRGHRPRAFGFGFTHPVECEGKMHAGRGCPPNGPYTAWLKETNEQAYNAFIKDYQARAKDGNSHTRPCVIDTQYFEDVFIANKAIEFIEDVENDFPWHMFVSFVGPHNPFDPPQEYYDLYKDKPMPHAIPFEPEGKSARYAKCRSSATPEHILLSRRLYAGYIKLLDDQVGRLIQALKDKGEYENTHIIFTADHGEMMGDHKRYTKGVHYEASTRVPLIITGPGIEPGVSDALVELNDLNPTCQELAGFTPTANIDARSLVPLLKGQTQTHREFQVSTILNDAMYRTHDWKYIHSHGISEQGEDELYYLAEDPDERVNVINQYPEITNKLKDALKCALLHGESFR